MPGGQGSFFVPFNEGSGVPFDLVNSWSGTMTAGAGWAASRYGPGLSVTSGKGYNLGDRPNPPSPTFTLIAFVTTGSTGSVAQSIISKSVTDGSWGYPYVDYILTLTASNTLTFGIGNGGFYITCDTGTAVWAANTPFLLLGTFDGVTQYVAAYNLATGAKTSNSAALAVASLTARTTNILIGSNDNSEYFRGTVFYAGVLNQCLYSTGADAIARDPLATFLQPSYRLWPSGGSASVSYPRSAASNVTAIASTAASPTIARGRTATSSVAVGSTASYVSSHVSTYADVLLAMSGLLAYYKLNDASFAGAADSKGTNTGSWNNTAYVSLQQPGLLTGNADTAASFVSSGNGSVSMPTTLKPTATGAFSWVVLFKATNTAANFQRLIGNDNYTTQNNGPALVINSDNSLRAWRATDAGATAVSSTIPNLFNTIHLAALTYDGRALRLYCDDACVQQVADTTSIAANTNQFNIAAAGSYGNGLDGTADEVAIFNTAITGEQVSDLYRAATNSTPAATSQLTYGAYYNDGAGAWDANPTVKWPAFVSKATNAGAAPNHVPKIAHFFQNWANDTTLNTAAANQAVTSGAQPMLTWEAWNPAGGTGGNSADQPTYSLNNIAAGNFNSYIDTFAASIASWGKPILVRLFHEYNDKIYPWALQPDNQADYAVQNTAALFVSAWQLVVNRCKAQGATNIRWVWCLNRHYNYSGVGSFDATSYPGDSYVDFAAFDMYNQLYNGAWEYPFDCGALVYRQIVGITTKDLMVCEFGANPDANGGTAVAWVNDFLGTVVPKYFPRVVAVVMESDASSSHANWGIDATAGTLAAYQSQYASSLYGGPALLPAGGTIFTKALSAVLSPTGGPLRAIGAVRSAVEGMTASRLRALARQVAATLGSSVNGVRSVGKARTAAVSPVGSRVLLDVRALVASVQPAGARLRSAALARAAALAPVGSAVRAAAWLRSATLGATGTTTAIRQRFLALVASLSPVAQRASTAGLVRAATAALGGVGQRVLGWRRAATASLTGASQRAVSLSRAAQAAITAARTRSATLLRGATASFQGGRALAGSVVRSASLGTTGLLQTIRQRLMTFTASLGPTGAGQRALAVLRSAVVAPTGLATRLVGLGRGATLAAGGGAQVLRAKILAFLASVSPAAGGTRATGLPRQAALALTGARARAVSLARSATAGLSGALGTMKAKTLTLIASVSPTGGRASAVAAVRVAVLSTTATLRRAVARGLSGTLAATGASQTGRAFVRAFSALFASQAARQDVIQAHRIGTFSPTAVPSRSSARALHAQETATGGLATRRAWLRAFGAAVSPGGALARVRGLTLVLQATDRATVALARAEAKSETAFAGFVGAAAVNRLKLLFLSAVVGLLGVLGTGSSQRAATLILWDVAPVTTIQFDVTPATTIQPDVVPATRIDTDIEGVA